MKPGAQLAAQRKKQRKRCQWCGKNSQMYKFQRFCSDNCRLRAHREAKNNAGE